MNVSIISGIVRSCEVKTTDKGLVLANLVIVDRSEWQGKVTEHAVPVTAFGKVAEACRQIKTGDFAIANGKLTSRTSQSKDGREFLNLSFSAQSVVKAMPTATAATATVQTQPLPDDNPF